MTDRIDRIRKLLEASPDDVFLVYSLGMELLSAGRPEDAAEQFARCARIDPEYLAAYVEEGKAWRSAGRLDQARRAFEASLALARRQGQDHIRDHIQQQLDGLVGA